jgi:hypothetical protein
MASAPFDPRAYLEQIDPGITYSCESLTGGIVNVTTRASKEDTANNTSRGRFPDHESLILKYAPPYIAGVGEAAPMTQDRQIIEAKVLSLFSPKAAPSLSSVCTESGVNLPALLHHDTEQHVLVLSDLGSLPNLSDIFAQLGGHAPGPQPNLDIPRTIFPDLLAKSSATRQSSFSSIGDHLGTFFATLHSRTTYTKILWQHRIEHFQVPAIKQIILNHAIKPVRDQLKLFPDLLSPEEADIITDLLVEDFQRDTLDDERSFVLGDSWTGAVLVDADSLTSPATTDTSSPRVGVIDWEFATFGRGLHGDIAQLLSHLEALRISARQSPIFDQQLQALDDLIAAMINSYTETTSLAMEELSEHVLISAVLTHAAEMVQIAFWKRWRCVTEACPVHGSNTSTAAAVPGTGVNATIEDGVIIGTKMGAGSTSTSGVPGAVPVVSAPQAETPAMANSEASVSNAAASDILTTDVTSLTIATSEPSGPNAPSSIPPPSQTPISADSTTTTSHSPLLDTEPPNTTAPLNNTPASHIPNTTQPDTNTPLSTTITNPPPPSPLQPPESEAFLLKSPSAMSQTAQCSLIRSIITSALWYFRIAVRLHEALEREDEVSVAAGMVEVGWRGFVGEDFTHGVRSRDGSRKGSWGGEGGEGGEEEEDDLLEFGNINGKQRSKDEEEADHAQGEKSQEEQTEPRKALLDLFRAVSSRAEAERKREFQEEYEAGHEVEYGYDLGYEHGYGQGYEQGYEAYGQYGGHGIDAYGQHGGDGRWN